MGLQRCEGSPNRGYWPPGNVGAAKMLFRPSERARLPADEWVKVGRYARATGRPGARGLLRRQELKVQGARTNYDFSGPPTILLEFVGTGREGDGLCHTVGKEKNGRRRSARADGCIVTIIPRLALRFLFSDAYRGSCREVEPPVQSSAFRKCATSSPNHGKLLDGAEWLTLALERPLARPSPRSGGEGESWWWSATDYQSVPPEDAPDTNMGRAVQPRPGAGLRHHPCQSSQQFTKRLGLLPLDPTQGRTNLHGGRHFHARDNGRMFAETKKKEEFLD